MVYRLEFGGDTGLGGATTVLRNGIVTYTSRVPQRDRRLGKLYGTEGSCRARPAEVDLLWERLASLRVERAPQDCPETDEPLVEDRGGAWAELHTMDTKVMLLECTELGAMAVRVVTHFFDYVCPPSRRQNVAWPELPGDEVPLWSPPEE